MTRREIKSRSKELYRELDILRAKHRREEKAILGQLEELQATCQHPKGYSYTDYGGFSNYTCPDCGYDH